ncbi:Shedu immune nuclease family protein [uncultured Nitratireductor sp.]|uniref:Shedu immune nuclease family protein n=1 Tax=uncultured Nitratireductor sp. TaxID=520953 RepID=UPI0025D1F7D6|nr:Shedu immune nuclease family protein [uncultured Nitratireductor sp.]
MAYYIPPPDPKGEIQIEELHPRCIEVWFIPEDDRLRAAGIDPKDREKHRVQLLLISAQDHFISIYPVNTLPTNPSFLEQKYNQVREITLDETDIWDLKLDGELPKTRDEILEVLHDFPSGFTKDPDYGLGLAKEYRFIVDAVEVLSSCTSIVITPKEKSHADEVAGFFYISSADFDEMRRKINSIATASQSAGRSVKDTTTHNYLAEKIGKPLVEVTAGRSPVRRMITAKATGEEVLPEDAQDAVIHALTKTAKSLGSEQTERLARLQSDIELVTLDALIERFEEMLGKKLDEAKWQEFFNANPFILNMAFGYPVIKVRDQASVGGRKLSGDGEKITDFLVKNSLTNNTAVFEIKTPQTPVLNKRPFREGVYTPSADLSGSINQALDQKYQFQKQVAQIKENTRLYDIESYAVHCCLVVGKTPEGEDQQKSFELFRRNSKDVELVTFDELLEKLKQLGAFLRTADREDAR